MSTEGVDKGRRRLLIAATSVVGAAGAAAVAIPFGLSLQPSARAKAAGAPVEADMSKLEPGQRMTVEWRGKPVWVVRRTEQNLKDLSTLTDSLRDPASTIHVKGQPGYAVNEARSIKPEFAILVGICTHLGCAPLYRPAIGSPDVGADWQGGFFCPCHGSRFDLAGRVFQSVPAPTNLEIPPHHYLSDSIIRIGEEATEGAA